MVVIMVEFLFEFSIEARPLKSDAELAESWNKTREAKWA